MKKVLLGVSMGLLALIIGIFTNHYSQEKNYYFFLLSMKPRSVSNFHALWQINIETRGNELK